MAISKNGHNNNNKLKPEPVFENMHCDNHEHNHNHNHLHLWDDFYEAKKAVYDIKLKTGEVHTEFYKDNTGFHCVVGIGNYNIDNYPLLLTDTGVDESILNQINDINTRITTIDGKFNGINDNIQSLIDDFVETINKSAASIADMQESISQLLNNINTAVNNLSVQVNVNKDNIATLNDKLKSIVSVDTKQTSDISSLKDTLQSMVLKLSALNNNIATLSDNDKTLTKAIDTTRQDIANINKSIKSITAAIADMSSGEESLDGLIETITKSIIDITGNISTLEKSIKNVLQNVKSISASVQLNDTAMANDIKSLANSVTSLKKSFQQSIDSLTNLLNNNSADVKELQDIIASQDYEALNKSIKGLSETVKKVSSQLNTTITQINEVRNVDATQNETINSLSVSIKKLQHGMKEHIAHVHEKIESIDSTLAVMQADIAVHLTKINSHSGQLKKLDSELNNVLEKASANEGDIKVLQNNIDHWIEHISSITLEIKELVDEDAAINEKIITLEHGLSNNYELITKVLKLLKELKSKVDNNVKSINSLNAGINSLKQINNVQDISINALTRDIADHDTEIDAMSVNIKNVSSKQAELSQELVDLKDKVKTISIATGHIDEGVLNSIAKIDKILEDIGGIKVINGVQNSSILADSKRIDENSDDIDTLAIDIKKLLEWKAIIIGEVNGLKNSLLQTQQKTDTSLNAFQLLIDSISDKVENLFNVIQNISVINSSVVEIYDYLKDIDSDIKEFRIDVNAIDASIQLNTNDITDIKDTLSKTDNEIYNLNASIDNVVTRIEKSEHKISDIADSVEKTIDNVKSDIDDLSEDFTRLEGYHSTIDASIVDLRNDVYSNHNDISILSGEIVELRNDISQLDEIDSSINAIIGNIDILATHVENNDTSLANHIEILDSSILNINDRLDNIDKSIVQQDKINELVDNFIDVVQDTLTDVSNKFGYIDDRIDNLEKCCVSVGEKIREIDTSIFDLRDSVDSSIELLNNIVKNYHDTSVIQDASFNSLFSDDIYTVNLCCYTEAGHIEVTKPDVEDNGEKFTEWLYDATYLTKCTDGKVPYGEYQTYVSGDSVKLTALKNKGYYFREWLQDGISIGHTDKVLILTFDNADFNVIPTLWDGHEHEPIKGENSYTAWYGKLFNLIADVSLLNWVAADVKEGDEISVQGYFPEEEGMFAGGLTLTFNPVPVNDSHEFKYYIVDGSTYIYDSKYVVSNVNRDYKITACFEEKRYILHSEPNNTAFGNIANTTTKALNIYESTYVKDSVIKLEARPEEGYTFRYWVYGKGTEPEILVDTVYYINGIPAEKPKIELVINQDIYITAVFEKVKK